MLTDAVEQFISSTLSGDAQIAAATNGRIYAFTTRQGVHSYPLIWWRIITSEPIAQDLSSVGEAWRDEAQIDVFCGNVPAAARLSQIVFDAFNGAETSGGILSCRAEEIVPAYADEDETIHYAVRVFINHKKQLT